MKKILGSIAFMATLAVTAPASASVTALAPGVFDPFPAITETFDSRTPNANAVFNPGGDGGDYQGIGIVRPGLYNDSTSAAPYVGPPTFAGADETNFLSIGPTDISHDPQTIVYPTTRNFFGLYWGSVDAYNTIDFYLNGSLVASYTGASAAVLTALSATGCQGSTDCNRYVVFDGFSYDKVVLGSSGLGASTPAFEVDNIASTSAVPEPATWAMMLIGFAGIGFVAYRRTKKSAAALAAA